ncbi:hypothetical protein AB1Y20_008611 [Prymnesium parvum]|uniref:Agenet domain-containing protein n=1 Tax=Prymnesium parvum TaxID=97485 RepID=A0AB34IS09_PRYPA
MKSENSVSSGARAPRSAAARIRAPHHTFPPAEEVGKGSRVELAVGTSRRQAEVVQMGAKERQGLARVHFCSTPGAEHADTGSKEWVPLSSLRPVPPEPPDGWTLRLQMYETVEARYDDSWVEVVYLETRLPLREDDQPMYIVRHPNMSEPLEVPAKDLRPVWTLNTDSKLWSISTRRSGPTGAVLLSFARRDYEWCVVGQINSSGPLPAFCEDAPRIPTPLEREAAAVAQERGMCSLLLKQDQGEWSFGGDGGMGEFLPPIAPLPELKGAIRFAVGTEVEVGPTDEGYVGSWFTATVVEVKDDGQTCVRYHTLEESDGVPLIEWQPCSCLRPVPPRVAPGCFPAQGLNVGDFVQLWYNDGWWEAMVVDEPELGKKQLKEKRKRQQEHASQMQAAREAGEEPPAPLAEPVCVQFLHYPEVHPNIDQANLRPFWVWRNSEWFWRVSGGGLLTLTTRLPDGKMSKDGYVIPTKKLHLPNSVQISLALENGLWAVKKARRLHLCTVQERRVEWEATVTLLQQDPADEESFVVHSAKLCRVRSQLEIDEPTPQACFTIGQYVEVSQEDVDYEGSYFSADLVSMQDEEAVVRYHAFEEEEGSNVKLTETVAVRRIRPRPPATPVGFLTSLHSGMLVEFSSEDGWWFGKLLAIGDAHHMPPPADARSLAVGSIRTGLDGKQYEVSSFTKGKTCQQTWVSKDDASWVSPSADSRAALLTVESHPYQLQHTLEARRLRPCMIWRWRVGRWDTIQSFAALDLFTRMQLEEERQRASNALKAQRRKEVAEAKRIQKQEEAESKRQQKNNLKEEKRRAKEAEEEAKRLAKESAFEEKRRQREEQERHAVTRVPHAAFLR